MRERGRKEKEESVGWVVLIPCGRAKRRGHWIVAAWKLYARGGSVCEGGGEVEVGIWGLHLLWLVWLEQFVGMSSRYFTFEGSVGLHVIDRRKEGGFVVMGLVLSG